MDVPEINEADRQVRQAVRGSPQVVGDKTGRRWSTARAGVAHGDSQSGNQTDAGALAPSRIMSVMQTCQQRRADPFEFIRPQPTSARPLPLLVTAR